MSETGHHVGTNYTQQGGAISVIGGSLEIASGAKITAAGTQAAHIATPTDLATSITAITAILVALENAGITAAS